MDVDRVASSVENYDEIVDWQQNLANSTSEDEFYKISASLVQFYGRVAKQGSLKVTGSSTTKKVATWLNEQLDDLWETTLGFLKQYPAIGSSVALKVILLRGKYGKADVQPLVNSLVTKAAVHPAILDAIQEQFIEFDDLRYMFLVAVPQIKPAHLAKLVPLMCEFEKEVKLDSDLTQIYAAKHCMPFETKTAALKYRHAHQAAWLHTLQHASLSTDQIKQVLTVMHARIIPNFSKPQLLMDFMVDAYEHGGAISLLSLNAIFVLIQYHQLDYPQFFTKLYELLEDGSLLASAHRARFLRLLDLFLTSTHLPAMIPASIIKRLARLCLFAPPGAIVAILPFVYNQIKRHPTCMIMIHRPDEDGGAATGEDPFNNDERDPLLTSALESSLWELQSLTSHYHPNVAAMAKIFSQPFRKPQYQLEHFLSHSYETLYTTEAKRKRDREPGLEFEMYNLVDESGWSL